MVAVPVGLILAFLRLVLFALALGMTVISFRAYREQGTDRLETAFVGFAFISMGVAVAALSAYSETYQQLLEIAETIPFIIGFSMLYLSLYR